MTILYNEKGKRRNYSAFNCPKCRCPLTRVHRTHFDEATGETYRRRRCEECGHGWYTAQEPEYLIPLPEGFWVKRIKNVLCEKLNG